MRLGINPVRAGVCSVEKLAEWPWTSAVWLLNRKERAGWCGAGAALEQAGGLKDTPAGRRKYVEYLAWLAEDEPGRKALGFEKMSQGWMIGSTSYARAILADQKEAGLQRQLVQASGPGQREELWRDQMVLLLRRLEREPEELGKAGKSVDWKLAVAAAMKARTGVTNRWLAENLHMGSLHEVSRKVSAWVKAPDVKLSRKLQ